MIIIQEKENGAKEVYLGISILHLGKKGL